MPDKQKRVIWWLTGCRTLNVTDGGVLRIRAWGKGAPGYLISAHDAWCMMTWGLKIFNNRSTKFFFEAPWQPDWCKTLAYKWSNIRVVGALTANCKFFAKRVASARYPQRCLQWRPSRCYPIWLKPWRWSTKFNGRWSVQQFLSEIQVPRKLISRMLYLLLIRLILYTTVYCVAEPKVVTDVMWQLEQSQWEHWRLHWTRQLLSIWTNSMKFRASNPSEKVTENTEQVSSFGGHNLPDRLIAMLPYLYYPRPGGIDKMCQHQLEIWM